MALQAAFAAGLLVATRIDSTTLISSLDSGSSTLMSTIALGLGVCAILLGAVALLQMRNSFRVKPTPRPDATLVREGIYRHLRHPMYSAVLGICAAITLHHRTVAVLAMALLNLVFYVLKARYEEGRLDAHYASYAAYRARSWGLIPGWGRDRSSH